MKGLSRKNLYVFSILVLMTVEILCSVELNMIFFIPKLSHFGLNRENFCHSITYDQWC